MTGQSVTRGGAWVLLDNASVALIAFVFFVVSARLLGPTSFGIGALTISVVQLVVPTIESLFHDAIVQREKLEDAHIEGATVLTLAWTLALTLGLWAAAPLIGRWVGAPSVASYLPWAASSLIFVGLAAVPAAEARRRLEFKRLALRRISGRVLATVVGLVMAWRGFGPWAIVAQFVLFQTLSTVFLLMGRGVSIKLTPHLSRVHAGEMLAFAAPSMGTQLLLNGNSRLITLIVGGVLGPAAAGVWNVAFRFVEPVQTLVATTAGHITLPLFSRRQTERGAIGDMFLTGTRHVATMVVPVFVGLALCARPIVRLFIGSQWLNVAPVMVVVSLVTLVLLTRQLAEVVLTSIGRPRLNFQTQVAASVISIAGVAAGVVFGPLYAALGWAFRVLPALGLSSWYVKREIGLSNSAQYACTAKPLMAALAMAGLVWPLERAMAAWSAAATLAVCIPAGAAIYFAVLALVDRRFRAEVGAIARFAVRRSGLHRLNASET